MAEPIILRQCEILPPLSGRTVVRCSGCRLVQFLTPQQHCRRCQREFAVASVAESDSLGLSQAVRFCREAVGLSQHELARRMGVKRPHISKIENGALPRVTTALRLAEAIGIPMWLFCALCEMRGL